MEPKQIAKLLHLLAAVKADGPVIEFGSFLGSSSAALCGGCRSAGRLLICVDPWLPWPPDHLPSWLGKDFDGGLSMFLENMKQAGFVEGKDFRYVQSTSAAAMPDLPDPAFLFVDSWHHSPVIDEELTWGMFNIKAGGVLAAHDYTHKRYPDVHTAWNKLVLPSPRVASAAAMGGSSGLAWAILK